jgi:hypothetical protein
MLFTSAFIFVCSFFYVCTNGGEEERVYTIGGEARGKETTRKTKT